METKQEQEAKEQPVQLMVVRRNKGKFSKALDSTLGFIKKYHVEIDSSKRLLHACHNYYKGKDDTIKNTTDICKSIYKLYKSPHIGIMFDVGKDSYTQLRVRLKTYEDHYVYRQFFSVGNKLVCEKIIKNIFDLVIIKILENLFDKIKSGKESVDSLEIFLIESLTKAGLIGLLANFAPMIAPCTFLAKETFKHVAKNSEIFGKIIRKAVITLDLAPADLSKKKWVSLYAYRILKQTNLTIRLTRQVSESLFVCAPITNGELTELVTGIRPRPKTGWSFDALMDNTSSYVISSILNVDEAKSAVLGIQTLCIALNKPLPRRISFELFLTQLSIVFLNELSKHSYFELINEYTTQGEIIVNQYRCSIMG